MRYRIDITNSLVYRLNGKTPEAYNFETNEWHFSKSAIEAFFEGSETYEATEKEAVKVIEKNRGD